MFCKPLLHPEATLNYHQLLWVLFCVFYLFTFVLYFPCRWSRTFFPIIIEQSGIGFYSVRRIFKMLPTMGIFRTDPIKMGPWDPGNYRQPISACIGQKHPDSFGNTGELVHDWPLYDRFLHMTDYMLGPSPMHIKYLSYVYDGFCIWWTNLYLLVKKPTHNSSTYIFSVYYWFWNYIQKSKRPPGKNDLNNHYKYQPAKKIFGKYSFI